eukprot:snap_masked-scaffold_5-processed-gene-13.61-mRNA-1 protein AED:0.39 eAED:0.42 QI:0/0/0/0.5/1/1/2/0/427
MKESEINSLHSQLLHLYATNKRALAPSQISLINLCTNSFNFFNKVTNKSHESFQLSFTRTPLSSYAAKEKLVYLTADSPNLLTELKPHHTYIIGGLVDKNRHKNICFNRAKSLNIPTARLPLPALDKSVLTVNHIGAVLLDYNATKSWQFSFVQNLSLKRHAYLSSTTLQAFMNRKWCVVFGGSSGFDLAQKAVQSDYSVIIISRNLEKLHHCETMLRSVKVDSVVIGYSADCTRKSEMMRLKFCLRRWFGGDKFIDRLILSNGTFLWDEEDIHNELFNQNCLSKAIILDNLFSLVYPHFKVRTGEFYPETEDKFYLEKTKDVNDLKNSQKILVIGSLAGEESFEKEMLIRGEAAVLDKEKKYIQSMQRLRIFINRLNQEAKQTDLIRLEPVPLVKTPLSKLKFQDVDWTIRPTSSEYVESQLSDIF